MLLTADVKIQGELKNVLKKLASNLTSDRPAVHIGFIDGATYANGTRVAYVAYLNEFGDHNPPRPFLKRTVEQKSKEWANIAKIALQQNGFTNEGVRIALERVGQAGEGDVKRTIKDWSPTDPRPNKPATIARKARRARSGKGLVPINPETVLIDSGVMISDVHYEVKL